MATDDDTLTRRELLSRAGEAVAGAALSGLLPAAVAGCETQEQPMTSATQPSKRRLPAIYVPHGGGPWPFVEVGFGDPAQWDSLRRYLTELTAGLGERPRAILCVTAHWEAAVPTVSTAASPGMLYDYYGFPEAAYRITWPAPGDPALAARVRALLAAAGIDSAEDGQRGYDHGTFVPLKLAFEAAEVPCVQLSLRNGLDPAEHLRIGRALAPLRDEGVLIVGSGMSYHNMRGFGRSTSLAESQTFDEWLRQSVALPAAERDARLTRWSEAPAARACHPREEHLLPLMVVAGAGGEDRGHSPYSEPLMGVRVSAVQFG